VNPFSKSQVLIGAKNISDMFALLILCLFNVKNHDEKEKWMATRTFMFWMFLSFPIYKDFLQAPAIFLA
jgi:hypothetical protein